MSNEDKLDKILAIVQTIEIRTAVQQQEIDTHSSYFRWIAGSGGVVSLVSIIVTVLIKVF